MDDAALARAASEAQRMEQEIRLHMETESGAFEQARAIAAYRNVVGLRKALEHWTVTRTVRARQSAG